MSDLRREERPEWKHPNDMDRDELREVVDAMSWLALDLAQHLSFSEMIKPEFKAKAWKQATEMAYELSSFPYEGPTLERLHPSGVTVLGEAGLEL